MPLRETIDKMNRAMNESTIKQTEMSSALKENIFKGGAALNLGIFLLQSKAPVEIVTHRLLFLKALCLQFFNPLTRFFLLLAHLLLKELGLCLQTLVLGFQKQIGGNNAQGKPYKEVYNCVHVV